MPKPRCDGVVRLRVERSSFARRGLSIVTVEAFGFERRDTGVGRVDAQHVALAIDDDVLEMRRCALQRGADPE